MLPRPMKIFSQFMVKMHRCKRGSSDDGSIVFILDVR